MSDATDKIIEKAQAAMVRSGYREHKWTPATVIDHLLFRAEKAERELAELRECVRAADAMRFALFGTFGKVIAAYDAARAKVKEASE